MSYWPIQNKASHYVIGNCVSGMTIRRNGLSGHDEERRRFSGGFIDGGFNACGWVPHSDNDSYLGMAVLDASASFTTCGGTDPHGSAELHRPVSSFARMVNCNPGQCGDGTWVGRTVSACTVWANVRPFSSSDAPSFSIRTLPAGYGNLRWRYVTKSGAYVMVRDHSYPRNSTQGSWGFVPRGCLPSQLYVQANKGHTVWCVSGSCSGLTTTTQPSYPPPPGILEDPPAPPLDTDGDGFPDTVDACPNTYSTTYPGCQIAYDVFARGTSGNIVQKQFREASGWTAFSDRGGAFGGDPTVASWSWGAIDLFGRGLDGQLAHNQFRNATGWTGWIGGGGPITGDPSVVTWGPGTLDLFARGTGDTLLQRQYRDATGWGWYVNGTAPPGGDPIAVSWGSGAIDLFLRGSDNTVWHRQYRSAHGWSPWVNHGGSIAGDPAVVAWGPGAIDIFARAQGTNRLVQRQYRDASGWSPWYERTDTALGGDPSAVAPFVGAIDVFARGADGQLIQTQYRDGTGWTGWIGHGGTIIGSPAVSAWK